MAAGAIAFASTFASVTLTTVEAAAQQQQHQNREILLGTIQTRDGRPESNARSAVNLLAEGIAALERGDVMIGRRYLEQVVIDYPETLAAGTAQRELARFFGIGAGNSPLRIEAGDTSRDSSRQTREGAGSQDDITDRRRLSRQQRLHKALARDFQITAGDRVFFGEASDHLGARARAVLTAQARWLRTHRQLTILIEAHADDHGNREFNVALSQKRGEAVRERLIEEGVEARRITMRAYGRDKPVATCPTTQCAAQNRRVVTNVAPDSTSSAETERTLSGDVAADDRAPSPGARSYRRD